MNKYFRSIAFALLAVMSVACEKDSGDLEIAEAQLNFQFAEAGGTKFATVKYDGEFTAAADQTWCTPIVYEGGRNNNLRITVDRNEESVSRTAVITVEAKGASPVEITVVQDASAPYISVTQKKVEVGVGETEFSLEIASNILFQYELTDWIHAKDGNVPATGKRAYKFEVDHLDSGERAGSVTIKPVDASTGVSAIEISVTQVSIQLPYFEEDFNWATGSSDIYTTAGEVRIDNWPANFGVSVWTYNTSGGDPSVWTRSGYVRFARTNYGGNMITPKLASISGTVDLTVTFKACRYANATGVTDPNNSLHIKVLGAGTASNTAFDIQNKPEPGVAWQDDPAAGYTFEITGATAETQIQFTAGSETGAMTGAGRLGFDDLKVAKKE